jgi:hypothetical protein
VQFYTNAVTAVVVAIVTPVVAVAVASLVPPVERQRRLADGLGTHQVESSCGSEYIRRSSYQSVRIYY